MEDLSRMRYVAANYYLLQGLRFAPLGVVFFLWAALRLGWVSLPPSVSDFLKDWGFGLALLCYPLLQIYYERTFGRAGFECKPSGTSWRTMMGIMGLVMLAVLGSIVLEIVLKLPVRLFGLVVAALVLAYFWPRRRFAAHYIALGLSIGLASIAASLMGLQLSQDWPITGALYLFMLGALFLVGGLFDHMLLVRTFKPLPKDNGSENGAI